MANLDPLGVIFMAKDLASAQIQKLERNFVSLDKTVQGTVKGFTQGMTVMGEGLAVFGVGAATFAPLVYGIQKAGEFQKVLLDIKKLAGDQASIPELQAGFLSMAPALGKTATALGQIGAAAASLGFGGTQDILKFTDGVSQMSVALDITEEQAGTVTAKMLNLFKLNIDQIQNLGSSFNQLADTTAATSRDIIDATFRASSSLSSLGATAPEVAALSASLVSLGLTPEIAGTSLRRMFEMAVAQPKKLAGAMGIAISDLQQRMGRDAVGTIMSFLDHLGKIPNTAVRVGMATQIFGEEGAKAANLLSNSLVEVRANMEKAEQAFVSGTSMIREFQSQSQGWQFSTRQLGSAFEALFVTLGMAVLPVITPIVKGLADLVQRFTQFIQPISGVVAGLLAFVGAFLMATGLVIAFKGALIAMKGILVIVGISMGTLVAVFVQAALIVGALITAFYLMKRAFETNFGGFGDFIRSVFSKASAFFGALVDTIASGEISGAMYEELQRTGMLEFVEAVLRGFSRVKAFLGGVLDGFSTAFAIVAPVAERILGAIMNMFSIIGTTIVSVINSIDQMLGGAGSQVKVLERVGAAGQGVGQTIAGVIGTTIAFVGSAVETVATVISGIMSLVGGFIQGFFGGVADGMPTVAGAFQTFGAVALQVFGGLVKFTKTFIGAIAKLFGVSNEFGNHLGSINTLGQLIGFTFGRVLTAVAWLFTNIATGVMFLIKLIGEVIGGFADLVAMIAFFVTNPWDAIALGINSVVDALASVFQPIWNSLSEGFSLAFQGVVITLREMFQGVASSLGAMFGEPIKAIKDMVVNLITSNPVLSWGLSKLGVQLSSDTGVGETAPNNVVPLHPKPVMQSMSVPTSGMTNQALGVGAQVTAAAATASAVRQTAAQKNDENSDQSKVLVTQIVLDRKVVAESVNSYNTRQGLRAGGIK